MNGQEDAGSLRVLRVKWVKWREKSMQERTGEMGVLSGLKPKRVFEIFEELTRIPRGSYNEKAVSDYIAGYGRERGLKVIQDSLYNVIIIREADAGRENEPAVILQGHIDMVNEKTPDSTHDFTKDPLDIYIDGDHIRARGTTLGGDDGIAVAYMLAILDEKDIALPRLEMVFTVSEEVGMEGAAGIDVSPLQGRQLINVDSEEEGILLAGCAGGMRARIAFPLTRIEEKGSEKAAEKAAETEDAVEAERDFYKNAMIYKLRITGLLGGHSGSEIDKQRINADHTLARILLQLIGQGFDIRLVSVSGGGKDNAIPFEAEAILYAAKADKAPITEKLSKIEQEIRNEYRNTDGGIKLIFEEYSAGEEKPFAALDAACMKKALGLILALPNGIVKMSGDIEGLVETSLNLGIVKTEKDEMILTYALRSSVDSAKKALAERVSLIAENYGAAISFHGEYPAWEYKESSALRDKMVNVFEKMYERKPEVTVIHAGLECGLLADKLPGLDAISFGPDLFDVHTVNEHLSISSAERMYEYLLEVLKV